MLGVGATLNGPAKVAVDEAENELYVADGHGNQRVVVLDLVRGGFKRHWGAYGNRPGPQKSIVYDIARGVPSWTTDKSSKPQQFGYMVHSVALSRDRMLYVADKIFNRIQVFSRNGSFLGETFVNPERAQLGKCEQGSVFDIAFSEDKEQTYLYVTDGGGQRVNILHRRSLTFLAHFGSGELAVPHSVSVDSEGSVYVSETCCTMCRVQKFSRQLFSQQS